LSVNGNGEVNIEGLLPGIYVMIVRDKEGNTYRERIAVTE
jgi:hypothetical protein